jgi:DNA gyrase/topoisomerase IV subunit A
MIDYYIEVLNSKDINFKPSKYPKPNLEIDILSSKADWDNILATGKGSLKTAPVMSIEGNVITITNLPEGKNIEHVRKIVDKEILLDKIDIRDESTEDICIVVEKVPHKQCDMKEIYKRLYNKLQANSTYNMAFYDRDKIYVPCSFDKVIRTNIQYLIDTHRNRIKKELEDLEEKLAVLEIIETIKLKNHTKKFIELDYEGAVEFLCNTFKCSRVQASKVLQKPISYLTKEHAQEIIDLENAIAELKNDQSDIFEFLVKKYKDLKKSINSVIKNKFKPTKFVK